MKYRPEIDGLRALAVVPVILFHAGYEMFSGGFVGVDVFFVISGYLITSLIIEDLENNRFSIVSFYERRARRILPALVFVTISCIPFAWAWLLPSQMKDFSQSLVAVSLFASNILFFLESDYFSAAAEEKPLLHTWSLAVEEQYYILFPIFLILIWRFGKNKLLLALFLLAIISLIFSEWGWRNKPVANFYLAPMRAWELFSGSIAALIVQKNGIKKNNFLSLVGLFAILFSIFFFNQSTPFPSVYTLIPVLGVVLLIIYANNETLVSKLLSLKIFVSIGLISYSTYLWHQPLFAFARVKTFGTPSSQLMGLLIILSIIIGSISWKYIEKPFRDRKKINRNQIFILSVLSILLMCLIGFYGHFSNGIEKRFDKNELSVIKTAEFSPKRHQCHFAQKRSSINKDNCIYFSGVPSVAVIGNSHATELTFTLAQHFQKKNIAVNHHSISGCKHNFRKLDESNSICYLWHENVVNKIINNNLIDTVIVTYRNEKYLNDKGYQKSLLDMLNIFKDKGKKVLYVFQAPLPGEHIEKYLAVAIRSKLEEMSGLRYDEWTNIYKGKQELIKKIPEEIFVINPADIFCENNSCLVIKNKKALYFDDNHISLYGSQFISEMILNKIIENDLIQ